MVLKKLTAFVLILLLTACAQIKSPMGGDVDNTASSVIASFPENYSTNFQGHEVELTFDEYVVLNNLQAQIIISPPLKKPPQITLKRSRTLSIKFEDELEENTTYTINFGNGVVDLNEGNSLDSSSWVFSTGLELDAGEIAGMVKDEYTGEYCEGCKIMLYEDRSDTAIYDNKPYYYALTDDSGRFVLKHLKVGTYSLFAFTDDNGNLTYQPGEEKMAFSQNPVLINKDSIFIVSLSMFREQKQNLFLSSSDIRESGKGQLRFSKSVENVALNPINLAYDTLIQLWNKSRDTLDLWFINPSGEEAKLAITSGEELKDSLSLFAFSRFEKPTETLKLSLDKYRVMERPIQVTMGLPVKTLVNELVILEDSIEHKASIKPDSLDPRIFNIEYPWEAEKKYEMLLLPGIVEDSYGRTIDTISNKFQLGTLEDYGELTLNIEAPGNKYFLLFRGTKGEPGQEFAFGKSNRFVFKNLVPGNYTVKVIVDENQNQQWDPGNWLEKRQPEKVFVYPDKIQIRRNWQVIFDWNLE